MHHLTNASHDLCQQSQVIEQQIKQTQDVLKKLVKILWPYLFMIKMLVIRTVFGKKNVLKINVNQHHLSVKLIIQSVLQVIQDLDVFTYFKCEVIKIQGACHIIANGQQIWVEWICMYKKALTTASIYLQLLQNAEIIYNKLIIIIIYKNLCGQQSIQWINLMMQRFTYNLYSQKIIIKMRNCKNGFPPCYGLLLLCQQYCKNRSFIK
ncbi:unnamed protein product [Paramecium sonneborni]|uniref:Transmembrane protein n=1 Tax=Paramecium sonneborni TaxID=65129 RepID=A0A8S1RQW1_9CILI|nr:unnamed protein product [Paramecium sonneborni]